MRRLLVTLAVVALTSGALTGVAAADQTGDDTDTDGDDQSVIESSWERTYDRGAGREEFHDAARVGDGYLLVGAAERGEYGSDRWDGWLVRIDANGSVVWNMTLGGPDTDVFTEVIALKDGYLVGGLANGRNHYFGGNRRLLRVDAAGEVEWSRAYRAELDWDRIEGLAAADDGQAMAAGGSVAMRVDTTDGDVVWERNYASNVNGVERLADGFAFAGMDTAATDEIDGWLGATDGNGSVRWTEHFVGDGFIRPEALAARTDGGFVLGGVSDTTNTTEYHALVVGTDATGDVEWERRLRDPTLEGWIYDIAAARENHVAVAGHSIPWTGWVVVLDGDGRTVAEHEVGDAAKGVLSLGDGEFLALGLSSGGNATVHSLTYLPLATPPAPKNETSEREPAGTTSSAPGSGFAALGAILALTLVAAGAALRRP